MLQRRSGRSPDGDCASSVCELKRRTYGSTGYVRARLGGVGGQTSRLSESGAGGAKERRSAAAGWLGGAEDERD